MDTRLLFSVAVLTTTAVMVMGLPSQYDDSAKKYIRYKPGTLNVIITAPHGGWKKPSSIADRTPGCFVSSSCVFEHDCGSTDSGKCGVKTLKDRFVHMQTNSSEIMRTYNETCIVSRTDTRRIMPSLSVSCIHTPITGCSPTQ